jgi:hypothetical protein
MPILYSDERVWHCEQTGETFTQEDLQMYIPRIPELESENERLKRKCAQLVKLLTIARNDYNFLLFEPADYSELEIKR